jgi:exonuclease SbcD
MLRVLHTADWHLGHTLHDHKRLDEHNAFLRWLVDTLIQRHVDALLICGDVFETANPPIEATRAWYAFLAEIRRRLPGLDVVVIGGNHDSAARLDAPSSVLDALDLHVVGGLPRRGGKELDLDRIWVPLHDAHGAPAAWVAAVPFLRVSDLKRGRSEGDEPPLVDGVRQLYARVLESGLQRRSPDQALVAMGHLYMASTDRSDSERRVLGGDQNPLPSSIFGPEWAYVALGHLHLGQEVDRDEIRYAGSPIPLSMTERGYLHHAVLVEFEGAQVRDVRKLHIPRSVDLIRLPDEGFAPVDEVLAALAELDDKGLMPSDLPFLEVRVRLDAPTPGLRQTIEAAVHGKAVRLVRVAVDYTGTRAPLVAPQRLQDLSVEEVFLKRWHRDYKEPPTADVLSTFHELIERAEQDR